MNRADWLRERRRLTVGLPDEDELRDAFEKTEEQGMPAVPGEYALEGAYHYYPPVQKVRTWIEEAGFLVLEEGVGDGYRHVLARGLDKDRIS